MRPSRPPRPRVLDCEPVPGEAPREIARDPDLLIVDKPAGWLIDGACPALDVDTTGVLARGQSPQGAALLGAAQARYLAVVDGAAPAHGERGPTQFVRRDQGPGWSLLDVNARSEGAQQVRRDLASLGHPVRGDARFGDPLDRRAPRALLHCAELQVGERRFTAPPPPDFGLYLGEDPRAGLAADPNTTCWRAWNGAEEGREALVDRYADWLWVQTEGEAAPADLPDARGVYQVVGAADRSRGQQPAPRLLRGEPAPTPLTVYEHGVAYLVELGDQLSTGLFLDQRPQRAWLSQHAGGRRVLNTFAHAGGYSVAAAVAGAETVSVDLSRRWLERVAPQILANGGDPARHDVIYGDCFDWLGRLGRRGERFDLIILDPPSTSVGKRKRRWSVVRDYHELVALALPLLAPGGELWTATNHRKTSAAQLAARVARALPEHVDLERVCPPAVDFPTRDSAPVKTLVWKDRR